MLSGFFQICFRLRVLRTGNKTAEFRGAFEYGKSKGGDTNSKQHNIDNFTDTECM